MTTWRAKILMVDDDELFLDVLQAKLAERYDIVSTTVPGNVLKLAREHDALVTLEEGAVMGGAGSAVAECLAKAGLAVPMLQLGLPDEFVDHGDPAQLLSMLGLDAAGIEQSIQRRFGAKLAVVRPAVNH